MISSIGTNFYNFSKEFEKNTMLNRGSLDVFGIWLPWSFMANNKEEKRERFIKSGSIFLLAFLAPILTIPFTNKLVTKLYKLSPEFSSSQSKIIQLSNEYLKSNENVAKGIQELGKSLNVDFSNIFQKFSSVDEIRKRIVSAKNIVLGSDLFLTGAFLGGNAWLSNWITEKKTGKTGFSAEFEMADSRYVEDQAKSHKKNQAFKMGITFGLVSLSSIVAPLLIKKSLLSDSPGKFLQKIKNNAVKFDYTKGIYMKRLPLFIATIVGGHLGYLLASRDNHERKDTIIRLTAIDTLFYGGDYLLNSVFARFIDKFTGTKLISHNSIHSESGIINRLKKIIPPIHSMEELNKMALNGEGDLKVLTKTKKAALKLYWFNFIAIILALGFGTPMLLNKMLKKNVEKDQKKFFSENNFAAGKLELNINKKNFFDAFEQKLRIS